MIYLLSNSFLYFWFLQFAASILNHEHIQKGSEKLVDIMFY